MQYLQNILIFLGIIRFDIDNFTIFLYFRDRNVRIYSLQRRVVSLLIHHSCTLFFHILYDLLNINMTCAVLKRRLKFGVK
jgi:hypothetical protein